MKRLILILALAFVVGLTLTAYAETQNVKVSGDLLFRGMSRDFFSLTKDKVSEYQVAGLTSTLRVRIDADLTDNVAVVVRLLNERSWGEEWKPLGPIGPWAGTAKDTTIDLDLAYVTLKEFLYSPITLTIGRQELHFGNDLIIGDHDTNWYAQITSVPYDLSARKAFDAVRATFNYEPLVVDAIYAKIKENDTYWMSLGANPEKKDIDLWGMNALYDMTALGFKGTLEGYYFGRRMKGVDENGITQPFWVPLKKDTCNTVGVLVKGQIVKDLTGSLEAAYQFGKVNWWITNISPVNYVRQAWATQLMLNYALPFEKIKKYSPNVGFIYTYLSGEDDDPLLGHHGRLNGWDPMFENQTPNSIINALFPNTCMQAWNLTGNMKPWEDVTCSFVYGYYTLSKSAPFLGGGRAVLSPYGSFPGFFTMTDNRDVGHAFDLTTTYDYTEDVQFGLTFGFFDPGSAFDKTPAVGGLEHNATQVIGSMKVTF